MKIKQIEYSALVNLGNYENEKVQLTAEVEDGENWEEALEELKRQAHSKVNNADDYYKMCDRYRDQKRKLEDITEKLHKAYDQWEEASNFIIAQGIKPSVPSFPIEKQNLITAGLEVVSAEVDEDWDEIPR